MDSAASKTISPSRMLDESGHKFGGDAGETPNSQGKGSSSNCAANAADEDTRMLSDRIGRKLDALTKVSIDGGKCKDLFRLMGNPEIWMRAYANIYANRGSMTPGVGGVTMDGMSEDRALNLIERLKDGTYLHKPARRTYIPKSNGKNRPLGIPDGDDKLVQEVCRMILERIYEPIFSDKSHAFRPKRSCHTALRSIKHNWTGVKWVLNIDIQGYFDNINHNILVDQLELKIDDKRFINLIKLMLKAGYMEDWKFHSTHSGTPQGGIISPLLSNVYLHQLDQAMTSVISDFNRGKQRKVGLTYKRLSNKITYRRNQIDKLKAEGGDLDKIDEYLRKIKDIKVERLALGKSRDPFDTNYRRMLYCRYADDFVIGVIGSKEEARSIYNYIKIYLEDKLALTISDEKSGISHLSEGFRYLGYIVSSRNGDNPVRFKRSGKYLIGRTNPECIHLKVPSDAGRRFAIKHGYSQTMTSLKGKSRPALLFRSQVEIIMTYNAELRGLSQYYSLAGDVKRKLSWLESISLSSLMATLANKGQTSRAKMYKLLKQGNEYVHHRVEKNGNIRPTKVYRLKHLNKKNPDWSVDITPNTSQYRYSRNELTARIEANVCEYCGKDKGYFEVHHVKKLSNLKGKTFIERMLIGMKRKTIVLCVECHDLLHAGRLPDKRSFRPEVG